MSRMRADELLVEQGFFETSSQAAGAIMAGQVKYNRPDMAAVKHAGEQVDADTQFILKTKKSSYVSRGGEKLAFALRNFSLSLKDKVVLDAGCSTGGFSDVALREGAREVVAVDVGYGQFAWSLRADERVRLYERTNIRDFQALEPGFYADIVVADLSFVPLSQILSALLANLCSQGELILLIKPQFELDEEQIAEGGIVSDINLHREALQKASLALVSKGVSIQSFVKSPIKGAKGNTEFLVHGVFEGKSQTSLSESVLKAIDQVLE